MDIVIGIDPGKTGGIAIYNKGIFRVHKMPESVESIDSMFKSYREISTNILVVIERIRLHRTDNMAQVSRMLSMFKNYNEIKALCVTNRIRVAEVSPKSWQSFLGLRTKRINAMERHERKKAYRDFAQNWWPEKLNIDVADAVCILIYAQRNLKYNPDFGNWSERLEKLI